MEYMVWSTGWLSRPVPSPPPAPSASIFDVLDDPLTFNFALVVTVAMLVVTVGLTFGIHRCDTAGGGTLESELHAAEAKVKELRLQLAALNAAPVRSVPKKEVRIWMDGAFDMMHYGHVNAFRQGRAMGTHLVVGVNDDASITRCKGAPPVMNDAERLAMITSCRFVDEVVPEVPYVMDDAYVRWIIQRYQIDFVVHGDDPCIVDGKDVYASAQALGKYRTIPRTEGVSTTEIVGRMLLLTSEHHTMATDGAAASSACSSYSGSPLLGAAVDLTSDGESRARTLSNSLNDFVLGASATGGNSNGSGQEGNGRRSSATSAVGFVRESKFMTTSQMLRLFAAGCGAPPPGAKVVYVDGGWDMFHAGHADFLKEAAALGDFLLVGLHNDVVVNQHRGANFPIMNLNERVLSVLSCRHTGDVVIDPPWHMTREMIAALNISIVAHGTAADANDDGGGDPYAVPKKLGIYREITSKMPYLTVDNIVARIQANHEKMKAKVTKKMASEREYYTSRYGFQAS